MKYDWFFTMHMARCDYKGFTAEIRHHRGEMKYWCYILDSEGTILKAFDREDFDYTLKMAEGYLRFLTAENATEFMDPFWRERMMLAAREEVYPL